MLWLLCQKKNLCTIYRRFMYLKLECHPNSHLQAIILLLLVDLFLHTLTHFAWYKYCTHVFSIQKNTETKQAIVKKLWSHESTKHCAPSRRRRRKHFLLFSFFLQEPVHTHLQKIKHTGSRFLDHLDQETKVRIGESRERGKKILETD